MTAMTWRGVIRPIVAAGFLVLAAMGASAPAHADDPACDWLGWRHPACAGGYYDSPLPSGPAGISPLPDHGGQMVPNIDGSLSLPGARGSI